MSAWTIDEDGWCDGALRYDSQYYDARPDGAQVDLLVIHNISLPGGHFGGPHVSDLFTGRVDYNADPSFADLRGLQVSAHFLCGAMVRCCNMFLLINVPGMPARPPSRDVRSAMAIPSVSKWKARTMCPSSGGNTMSWRR